MYHASASAIAIHPWSHEEKHPQHDVEMKLKKNAVV
jgi:hypothetical protein